MFNLLEVFDSPTAKRLSTDFVYKSKDIPCIQLTTGDTETDVSMTIWVVGNLDTPEGLQLVKGALQHLEARRRLSPYANDRNQIVNLALGSSIYRTKHTPPRVVHISRLCCTSSYRGTSSTRYRLPIFSPSLTSLAE